jgi:hypothetical protein
VKAQTSTSFYQNIYRYSAFSDAGWKMAGKSKLPALTLTETEKKKKPSLEWYNERITGRMEKDLSQFRHHSRTRKMAPERRAKPGTDFQPQNLPLRAAKLPE